MARKEGLIGRKMGMTQVFADDGSQVQVTVIEDGLPRLRRPAARVRREEEERVETRGGVVQEGERGSDAGDPRGPAREDREAPGLPARTGADSRDVRAR